MQEARDERDWESEYLASVVPGHMYLRRGDASNALGFYRQALDTALSRNLVRWLAPSYHDLALCCAQADSFDSAEKFGGAALRLYLDVDARSPLLTAFLADRAEARFSREPSPEHAADALLAWRSVPAVLHGARERLLAACNLLVASAWLDIRSRYHDGADALETAFAELPDRECSALALAHASTGAAKMCDYPRALSWANRAVLIATERGELSALARAEEARHLALAERSDARLCN